MSGSEPASPGPSAAADRAASEPVSIAFIGCGDVVRHYAQVVEMLRGAGVGRVVLGCDRNPEREVPFRALFPGAAFATDPRAVLDSDVDVVAVTTAMRHHGELAIAALRAGKHVLVEKPIATTLDEGRELLETAELASGLLVCAPHVILSPTFRSVWGRLRRGDIGRITMARARYGSNFTRPAWFYGPGAGPLRDLGVYNLTALTGLIGPVRRVTALGSTVNARRSLDGVDFDVEGVENAHVLLGFADGAIAVVSTGFAMQRYLPATPAIELYGTEGVINLLGHDWAPEGYVLWQEAFRSGEPFPWDDVGDTLSQIPWQHFPEFDPDWPWMEGLRHLVECVVTGERPAGSPEHAYHVLEVIVAAEEAMADGTTRDVTSDFPPIDLSGLPSRQPTWRQRHFRAD